MVNCLPFESTRVLIELAIVVDTSCDVPAFNETIFDVGIDQAAAYDNAHPFDLESALFQTTNTSFGSIPEVC